MKLYIAMYILGIGRVPLNLGHLARQQHQVRNWWSTKTVGQVSQVRSNYDTGSRVESRVRTSTIRTSTSEWTEE